jgi:hypothetical protein
MVSVDYGNSNTRRQSSSMGKGILEAKVVYGNGNTGASVGVCVNS